MLYKCFVFTGQLWNIYSIHIFLKHVLFQSRQGGLHIVWKYIFCDFSSGISYSIIKNQMSTYKICNIVGYRVSVIQFTKKWRRGHAVVITGYRLAAEVNRQHSVCVYKNWKTLYTHTPSAADSLRPRDGTQWLWYRCRPTLYLLVITCISYMKLGFPTFYGAK